MALPDGTTSRQIVSRIGMALCLFSTLYLPFAAKPVHIDDANFLMLAEGAARDPWRPQNIEINWSGKTEPAFDILANPPASPGIWRRFVMLPNGSCICGCCRGWPSRPGVAGGWGKILPVDRDTWRRFTC